MFKLWFIIFILQLLLIFMFKSKYKAVKYNIDFHCKYAKSYFLYKKVIIKLPFKFIIFSLYTLWLLTINQLTVFNCSILTSFFF